MRTMKVLTITLLAYAVAVIQPAEAQLLQGMCKCLCKQAYLSHFN